MSEAALDRAYRHLPDADRELIDPEPTTKQAERHLDGTRTELAAETRPEHRSTAKQPDRRRSPQLFTGRSTALSN